MKIQMLIQELKESQKVTGEFKSFCFLPQSDDPNWYYTGDSPFVTANILFALRNIQDVNVKNIIASGIEYLNSIEEKFGLYRYWKHNNGIMEYNVPCDLDDTALVYFLKKKFGRVDINIEKLILNNQSINGKIYTWFRPTLRHLNNPRVLFYLFNDLGKSLKVFLPNKKIENKEPISSLNDSEQAVVAHVLLALGERTETTKSFNKLIYNVLIDDLKLEYYDSKFYIYHHISRAYNEGQVKFENVKEKVINDILNSKIFEKGNEFELINLLNLITLQNFNFSDYSLISDKVLNLLQDFDYRKPYKYWTSKQRSWWAGSEQLTLALYIEFLYNLKFKK